MKSEWLLMTVVFLGLGASCAQAGGLQFTAESPVSAAQAQQDFEAVVEVAALNSPQPLLDISESPFYAIASVSGLRPRVVVSRAYLSRVTRSALKFAFAHELAHLQLKHHDRIKNIRIEQEAALAAAPGSGRQGPANSIRSAYHAIEYSADVLAMRWCSQLGCDVNDASIALMHAYGFFTAETETHPALDSRMNALRFFHDIP